MSSNTSRKKHVKETGVRWSELLRLPYFDPIRFIIIDPMHCLFLGIAKWIVKRIWVDEGILSPTVLNKIQGKMKEFHVQIKLIAERNLQISLQINGGPFSQFTQPSYFGTIFQSMTVKFLRIL